MANFGMLREYRFTDPSEDIRGAKLYGLDDEKLGKIDDVIFDYATGLIRYVVVDTGGWLSTKKFIVPANRLRASARHNDDFEVALTKAQVESFPHYHEQDLESDEQWSDYEGRYRAKWEADPVMHRAETDRNIIPTTQQMEGNLDSELASGSINAARRTLAKSQRRRIRNRWRLRIQLSLSRDLRRGRARWRLRIARRELAGDGIRFRTGCASDGRK